jgi:hypothetical protein
MVRFVLAVVAFALMPLAALAQEAPAEVVPEAAAFGDGWRLVTAEDGPTDQWPPFRRFTAAVYFGPDGSRVLVGVIAVAPGAVEDRSAWTLANGMLQEYRGRIAPDAGSDELVNDVAGCSNLQRLSGGDLVIPSAPVGLSLCEAGERIVLAYVSGELSGLSGKAASDRVVEAALGVSA